jgi:hypothetical protein
VGGPAVAQLAGNLKAGEFGLFVTMGPFGAQARQKADSRMRPIDGNELVLLILATTSSSTQATNA